MRYVDIKEQDEALSKLIGKKVRLEVREECFSTYIGTLKKIRWCEHTTLNDDGCWELDIGNFALEYDMLNEDFTLYVSQHR